MSAGWGGGFWSGDGTAQSSASVEWGTPQRHDAQGPKTPEQIAAMRAKGHGVKNLNEQVQADWPTPASGGESGGPTGIEGGSGNRKKLAALGHPEMKSGKLNPSWVETLMGLPLGHTQLPVKFAKPRRTP